MLDFSSKLMLLALHRYVTRNFTGVFPYVLAQVEHDGKIFFSDLKRKVRLGLMVTVSTVLNSETIHYKKT